MPIQSIGHLERLLAQPGIAQPRDELPVMPVGHLPVEQEGEPFRMGERRRLGGGLGFAEGLAMPNRPS